MPIKGLGNPYSTVTSSAISNAMRTSGTQGKSLATNKNEALSVVARSEARVTLKDASLFSDLIRVSQTPLTQVKQLNVGLKGMADTISKLSSVVKTAENANPDQVKLLEQQGKDLIEIYNTKLGNIKFSDKNLIKNQELALNLRVSSGVDDVFEVRVEEFRNIDGAKALEDNINKGDEMIFGAKSAINTARSAAKAELGAAIDDAAKARLDTAYNVAMVSFKDQGFDERTSKKMTLHSMIHGLKDSANAGRTDAALKHLEEKYTAGDKDIAKHFNTVKAAATTGVNHVSNRALKTQTDVMQQILGFSAADASELADKGGEIVAALTALDASVQNAGGTILAAPNLNAASIAAATVARNAGVSPAIATAMGTYVANLVFANGVAMPIPHPDLARTVDEGINAVVLADVQGSAHSQGMNDVLENVAQKGQARLGVVNGMKMGSPADIKATEAALDAISKQLESAISRTESAISGIEEMVKGMTLSQEFAKDTAGQIQNVDVLDASDKVSEASKAITLAAQVKGAGNKAINQVLETAGEELRR